jgi:hypothetical protein
MIVILQYTKDHCFIQSWKGGSVFRPWVVAFFTGGWYRFTPMLKSTAPYKATSAVKTSVNVNDFILAD